MEERTGDNAMRLVIAEVPASTGWHGRVSELLAHVMPAADHLLLLVPPRLLADCRSLFDDMKRQA